MEVRKITIVETKNQKKSVIMSSATTLSELKADLRQNGIDYNGMTFFEGTSKVELKNDASVLPHDVPYKGTITNELVFMLTNTNKKIKSGSMTRMEAYQAIKSMGLQAECVKRFGKNYTMCKTVDLISLIEETGKKPASTSASKAKKPVPVDEETKAPEIEATEVVDTKARAAISRLVEILDENDSICTYEKEEILDILGGKIEVAHSEDYKPSSASPYSDDEIDDMFEDMDIH